METLTDNYKLVNEKEVQIIKNRVRLLIGFFIVALVLSGITAIPLKAEITILNNFIGKGSSFEKIWPSMADWLSFVYDGLISTDKNYPFILYGTDWLAFAHIVIAIAFIGPLRDPVRNLWVIEFGLIACVLIIPTALIFGSIRGIPIFWRVIDCSFGVFGFIPLWFVRRDILTLSELDK